MKLSRISLAILPLLSLCSVQAAVYNVVEVGEVPELKSTYASAINDAGDVVFNGAIKVTKTPAGTGTQVTVFEYYNFPIRLEEIDFEDEDVQAFFTDEQLADISNGNIDADIQNILLRINPTNQPIGNSISYLRAGNAEPENLVLVDNSLTRGNSEYLYGINASGVTVGTATSPFTRQSFTPEATEDTPDPETVERWVPDLPYQSAAAIVAGSAISLPPPYLEYGGGVSAANNISDNGIVAGFGSVGLVDEAIETLEENCDGADEPVNTCYYSYHTNAATVPGTPNQQLSAFGYTQRGLLWQLNGGTVSSPTVLGFLGDKNSQAAHAKENVRAINYYSEAKDVNNAGVAVGMSLYSDSDRVVYTSDQIYRAEHATLFVENEALPMVDATEWQSSRAVAINNNDIAVGYAIKTINSANRSKLFYYDYPTDKTTFVTGFFSSSTTVPQAINDSNQVVGSAEVIIAGTTTRRRHGFIYDIESDSFRDLNTLIACDSPYTVVDANDINNNGVVLATAIVSREARDVMGDVVVDAQGNPVMEEVTTTIKLQPVANGEPDDCAGNEQEYERNGGSTGLGSLVIGAALLWWRRRRTAWR